MNDKIEEQLQSYEKIYREMDAMMIVTSVYNIVDGY